MKKKRLLLFLSVLMICCLCPGIAALAESNLVSADSQELVQGNPFSYQIDLTSLPDDFVESPYVISIAGGALVKDITCDNNVTPTYDAEKQVYTIPSDQLKDIATLTVTVTLTEEAITGQQLTITTTVVNDAGTQVSEDLPVTITAPPVTPEEEGDDITGVDDGTAANGGDSSLNTDAGSATAGTTVYAGSANNYLKSLSVRGLDLSSGFYKTNATYFLTIDQQTSSVTVNAKADDSKSTVVVAGNTGLQSGLNKILISVTAENGSVRYYRIYVTKEAN